MASRGGTGPQRSGAGNQRGGGRGGSQRGGGNQNQRSGRGGQQHRPQPAILNDAKPAPSNENTATTTTRAPPIQPPFAEPQKKPLDQQANWQQAARAVNIAPYIPRDSWFQLPENRRLETLEEQNSDLVNLLKMPHARFWPSILKDESVRVFIESFTRFYGRPYEKLHLPGKETENDDDECAKLEKSLAHRVLLLLLRLVTRTESPMTFWSPEGYAKHVGPSGLITVSILMDACAIYCPANRRTVQSIIQRAFDHIPMQLIAALGLAGDQIVIVLTRLAEQLDGSDSVLKKSEWDLVKLYDMHYYFEDIAWSLKNFWETATPSAALKLAETKGLLFALMISYNGGLSALAHSFLLLTKSLPSDSQRDQDFHQQHDRIRMTWLWLGHRLLNDRFFAPLSAKTQINQATLQETMYSELLTVVEGEQEDYDEFSHHLFMQNLNQRFLISRTLRELSANRQDARLDFVRMALGDLTLEKEVATNGVAAMPSQQTTDETMLEKMSLIAAVKDLLPELGDGFVDECLKYYQGQVESVINHVLEGTLADPLKSLDQKMPLQLPSVPKASHDKGKGKGKAIVGDDDTPPPPPPSLPKRTKAVPPPKANVVLGRTNLFDDDEFDVFARGAVEKGKVHIKQRNNDTPIDAKSFLSGGSNRANQPQYDVYEDEYDDTFDDEDIQPTTALRASDISDDPDSLDPLLAFDRAIIQELLRARGKDITIFERVPAARRSDARAALRLATGLTDEQIEGWNLMMLRHPPKPQSIEQIKLLEIEEQSQHKDDQGDEEEEEEEEDEGNSNSNNNSRPSSQRGSRGGGMKDRNKSRHANHNRKEAASRKMNRGMGGALF